MKGCVMSSYCADKAWKDLNATERQKFTLNPNRQKVIKINCCICQKAHIFLEIYFSANQMKFNVNRNTASSNTLPCAGEIWDKVDLQQSEGTYECCAA